MVFGGAKDGGRRGFGARHLVAITAVLFAARLILSLTRSGPVLVADEIGYLMNARVIAGGIPGQLQLAPFYHGGYSLLLAPLVAVASDPRFAYGLVLALNAALAASVFPLLYALLTRCADVAPRLAVGPALAGSLYPTITVLSQVAMSENALYPLTCVWLISFCALLRSARDSARSILWAGAVGASAAGLWAVHGRMITVVILSAAIIAWLCVRRRIGWLPALTALGVLGVGLLASHFLDSFLVTHNYGGHASNEASGRTRALVHPHALLVAAENLLGQAWYLIVATFGLAAVACAAALRPTSKQIDEPARSALRLVAALSALLLLVSAASFTDRTRPDMLIYGRYTSVVAPPLVALGLVVLGQLRNSPRIRRGMLALAGLTAAIVLFRLGMTGLRGANRWNVASLPFVTSELGPPILVGAAAVAAGGGWLLRRASSRRPSALWLVVLGLFLPTVAYGIWNPVLRAQGSVYPPGWRSPSAVAKRLHITAVGYDTDRYVGGLYAIQWFLPHTSIRLFSASRKRAPLFVLGDHAWSRLHPSENPVALWSSSAADLVLWRQAAR